MYIYIFSYMMLIFDSFFIRPTFPLGFDRPAAPTSRRGARRPKGGQGAASSPQAENSKSGVQKRELIIYFWMVKW